MQGGKIKIWEVELGGEADKMSLMSKWKGNWGQRGWDVKLRDKTVTGWAKQCKDQGKPFNMNMSKVITHMQPNYEVPRWNLFLPVVIGRWKDVGLSEPIAPPLSVPEMLRGAAAAGGKVTHPDSWRWQKLKAHWWQRWKSNITSALHFSHCCLADKHKPTVLSGIILKLKSFLHNKYIYLSLRGRRL